MFYCYSDKKMILIIISCCLMIINWKKSCIINFIKIELLLVYVGNFFKLYVFKMYSILEYIKDYFIVISKFINIIVVIYIFIRKNF